VKTCSKCGVEKDGALFHKNKQAKDGLHPYCAACKTAMDRARFHQLEDLTAHRARVARWREENPERAKELERAAHQKHKDKRNEYSKLYREQNLEKTRALCRKWAKDNPLKMLETNAKRRAQKAKAIPAWANDEFDAFVMQEAYDVAKSRSTATGIPWHVDHVVPLRSEFVCGLHCSANIQVITAMENHVKGNRVWPSMW
jgi:hypothetical protein